MIAHTYCMLLYLCFKLALYDINNKTYANNLNLNFSFRTLNSKEHQVKRNWKKGKAFLRESALTKQSKLASAIRGRQM